MENKRKKYLLGLISVFCLSVVLGIYFMNPSQTKISAATPLPGYTMMNQAPGINLVSTGPAKNEISGDYGFSLKLTDAVSYAPIGGPKVVDGYPGSPTKVYKFNKEDAAKADEYGVWIRNAGLYNGRSVDVKFLVDSMDVKPNADNKGANPEFQFFAVDAKDRDKKTDATVSPDGSQGTWSMAYFQTGSGYIDHYVYYSFGDKINFHYEFYYNDTNEKLPLKGSWNYNNLNGLKTTITTFAEPDFKNYFVMNNTKISYKVENGLLEMSSSDDYALNVPEIQLTQLFEKEQIPISMAYNPADYNGAMAILYSTESLTRIAPATPIVYGQRNSTDHTDPAYKELKYSILQGVADNRKENRNDKVIIDTEVPDFYDITDVKIVEYGTTIDKTNLFTPSITGSKLTLTSKDSTSDAFNGSLFDIQITAKPNSKFKFDRTDYGYVNDAANLDDNGFMLFELGGSKTKTTYTYNNLAKPTNELQSQVVKDQSVSQVLYEGIPYGTAKTDVTIPMGGNIATAYPNPKDLLESYDVDTDNDIDRPVTVSYKNGTPPSINAAQPGDVIPVELIMTSAKGIEMPITVNITVTQVMFELDIEHLDAETGAVIGTTNPLPSGEKDVEYTATSQPIAGYIPTAVLVDGVDKTPSVLTDPLTVTAKFVTNKKVTFKYTKLRTPMITADFEVNHTTAPLGGQVEYTAKLQNTAETPSKWRNVSYNVDTAFPEKVTPDVTSVTVNGVAVAAGKAVFNETTRKFSIDLGDLDQTQVTIKYKVIIAPDANLQLLKQTYTVSGDEGSKQSNETSLNIIAGESQLTVKYMKKDGNNNDVKMDPDYDNTTTEKDGTAFDIELKTFDGYVLDKIVVDGTPITGTLPSSIKGKYGEVSVIEFHYKGTLLITSSPDLLDFEMQEASAKKLRVESAKTDKDLVVTDTRSTKQRWYLYAKVTEDFKTTDGSNKTLSGILRYNDGGINEKKFPVNQNQLLTSPDNFSETQYNISQSWTAGGKGFKVEVPGDYVKQLGEYRAKIVYTLSEVPDLP